MPYPDDGELLLWGDSKEDGAIRLRFPNATTFHAERLVNGAWQPLTYNAGTGGIDVSSGALTVGQSGIAHTHGTGTANGAGVAAVERADHVRSTTITITDLVIDTTDATTAGAHGTHKLYDFPEGYIRVFGAVMDLTTAAGEGGITDTAQLVGSLGSAAVGTDNAVLGGTEADIIPSTAGTLTAGAGTLKGLTGAQEALALLDGTTTAADLHLNIAIPDAGSTADDTVTVNGTITIMWANLGDLT